MSNMKPSSAFKFTEVRITVVENKSNLIASLQKFFIKNLAIWNFAEN